MIDKEIRTAILENLTPWLTPSDINTYSSNGCWTCSLKIKDYWFYIDYEIIDNFYKVKMEYRQDVLFLSKSKKYKNSINKIIKVNKLNKRSIGDHMISLSKLINQMMATNMSFDALKKDYNQDIDFDGIFL